MLATSLETTVFTISGSVAVRLRGSCRLAPGTRVRQHRDGNRIVIEILYGSWPELVTEAAGAWHGPLPRAPMQAGNP